MSKKNQKKIKLYEPTKGSYYELLEISPDITELQILSKYYELDQIYFKKKPISKTGSIKEFYLILAVLTNPFERGKYDQYLRKI
jgi:curved DNA-binding protein CbpA